MRKQKHLILGTVFALGLSSLFAPTASANADLDRIESERDTIQSEIAKQDEELTALEKEIQQINEQIARVEQAIIDNQKMIDDTEEGIAVTEAEIATLEEEIKILEEQIEARFELLKQRAVSYHQNGGSNSNFLEVVFGSTSFSNFIDRVVAVTKIAEADNTMIESLEADQAKVEEARVEVATKLEELQEKKVELDGMKHHILEQQEQNEVLKAEVQDKVKLAKEEKSSLQARDSELASEAANIEARQNEVVDRSATVSLTSATTTDSSTTTSNASSASSSPAPASSGNGSIQVAMDAGRKYIGNSVYVFGGGRSAADIAAGRFDCSAFVAWAMGQAGYSVPASTDGLRYAGKQIAAGDRQPGDLVFFNTYKTDGHVGIYLGNNKFIGAQSSTGVAIADMSSGYWNNTFSGRVVRVH
ncbi:NlpC/P60 family protein [Alkalihalobacillus sp. 1P02AB]|uniref:C40 family peptidase n=1 Tax=Alkalihalobacillus sp. 1P02AB TaxID=3132260 RepID=UPI0039A6336A